MENFLETSIVSDLFSPLSLEQFQEEVLFKAPFAQPFVATQFKDLISWERIKEILSSYDNCWLAKFGKLPQEENLKTGSLTYAQAKENFERGYSIFIRHSEKSHPIFKKIAENFQKNFNYPIDVHLYITPKGEEGFGWHYDTEEVFILQTGGEKSFRLRPDSPFSPNRSKQEFQCILKSGDFLYIPAGFWHKAKALTDSFHISVGIKMRSDLKEFTH